MGKAVNRTNIPTNITLAPKVKRMGEDLAKERDKSFSSMVADLIREEHARPRLKPGIQSFMAPRKPFDERVAKASENLIEDFKGYMAKCMQRNPQTGGKSAMFESWAIQELAWLVVQGEDLGDRLTNLEGASRR